MNDYLERFEKLLASPDQQRLQTLYLEVKTCVDTHAEFLDHLKWQNLKLSQKTEELCVIRDMVRKQLKENKND